VIDKALEVALGVACDVVDPDDLVVLLANELFRQSCLDDEDKRPKRTNSPHP